MTALNRSRCGCHRALNHLEPLNRFPPTGYGYLTPHTTWGKICTVLYALVGIPLMLLYMSNVGAVLANCFKFIYFRMCR